MIFLKRKTVHGLTDFAISDIKANVNRLTDLSRGIISKELQHVLASGSYPTTLADQLSQIVIENVPWKKQTSQAGLLSSAWRTETFL